MTKQQLKEYIFNLYDNKCAVCGFTDIRALQLDHKNGSKEKQGDYERGGTGLYYAIYLGRRNKDDFQLLCANHNWIKRYTNNEHKPTAKSQTIECKVRFKSPYYRAITLEEKQQWLLGINILKKHLKKAIE